MKQLAQMTITDLHEMTGVECDLSDYIGSVHRYTGYVEFVAYTRSGRLSEAVEVDDHILVEYGYQR